MPYYPIFLNLEDQAVLVVGGGEVAARKVRSLLKAGAQVLVVARSRGEEIDRLHLEGKVDWIGATFQPEHMDGCVLAFAATSDRRVNRAVFEAGEARGIPVNSVDDIDNCRFISPAVVDRNPVQVAISTGGTSPVLARRVRSWIERLLPLGLGKVAQAAGRVRASVAQRMGVTERRRYWEAALTRTAVSRMSTQSPEAVAGEFQRHLAGWPGIGARGKVYLVGAGPGRPDLLTLRGLEVLQQADVILHDRLVSEGILDLARTDAARLDVGKRDGNHHRMQEKIGKLLVEKAREGKTVVRLKGGDPFVFGRGGEELQLLREHDIDFEVVPGITAAAACAAYAGIPLTHRDLAHSVTFLTGHTAADSGVGDIGTASDTQTLAVYMGVKQAKKVRRKLLNQGFRGSTPAALIVNGTMDAQRVVHGSIDQLPVMAKQVENGEPGIFIIGKVAALSHSLSWFESDAAFQAAA